MRTTLATGGCGALGMLAVMRASMYYRSVDKLAFSITLLMGLMLGVGVLELLWVAQRNRALREELDAIPKDTGYECIERASPLLRSLLSARLDRTALPVPGAVFAPFILSLLVMLGLLGTFLGLFETLRGAGLALDASADVEALRTGLRAPISGLMRSFGTSAAGVASSSMLGLAAVFVRRDSHRFGVALHEMASGRLARFAPASRQLLALETLAEQGQAWPRAAAAVEQAVAELRTLQSSWREAHAEAAEHTKRQLEDATRTIREAIESGVQQAAASSSEAIRPLLRDAIADSGTAVREHLGQLREQLSRDIEDRKLQQAKLQQLAEQQLQELASRLEEDARARRAHEEAVRAQTTEHVQRLAEQEAQRMQVLLDGESERARTLVAQWQELARGVQLAFEQAGARDLDRAAALSEVGARMQRDLADAASVLRERLQHSAQAEATQQARAEALFARLAEAAKVIAEAAQTQVGALGQFVEATDGRLHEAEQRSRERLGEVLAQWSALGQAQVERVAAFEQTLLQQHASTAGELGRRLGQHAEALQDKISRSAELLEQASTLVHGGGAELAAVAESFANAVASQREGARQWLEALGDIERYALEAGEAAAADALGQHLARTHEVFEKQLQFQQELITQLHGMRTRESSVQTRADASA